ncbi:MAG: NADP-reducing hydrogenase subunit HndC [candidate division WS2 bacterium]|nr:NADP-reducing hydrogenase subunit HndC [Candidatus Lithacetigena glycinireducens]
MKDKQQIILVCEGTGCVSGGSEEIYSSLEIKLSRLGLNKNIHIKRTGCHGFCQQGPLVVVEPEGIFYSKVKPTDVPDITQSLLPYEKPVERLFYRNPLNGELIPYYRDIPFYNRQQRVILRNCGNIDPENINDYFTLGGYQAIHRALFEMTPEQVIEEVKRSGLRGMGGAGFLTGLKWEYCRKAEGDRKYIICNADEGDPGAFMDRSLLEGDPHSVLEGMFIGAYAIGTTEGYIYVRAEYPLAVKRLRIAIAQMEEHNLLGDNILGSGLSFHIKVKEGAGAFVCGEETALIASIEGWRGMPRSRPPFPAQKGLWGKPTIINNVKTFANIPLIIGRGSEWFASLGSDKSKGTAVFSLTGNVANCGLIEVPMGIKLREIIYDIGGGIPNGKAFKAVQTGGPSGGCLPNSLLDMPVDFDSLTATGSMMGSGGMVVMDEETCMVDIARYFLDFTQKESCGKCVPCRLGTKQLLMLLEKITQGNGEMQDLTLLHNLAEKVKSGSLCGLGQTAPNPIITTLKYFKDEYIAHIQDKVCPAKVCKNLIHFKIDADKCKACTLCLKACPVGAIKGAVKQVHVIEQDKCIKCGVCLEVCPPKFSAVLKLSGKEEAEND